MTSTGDSELGTRNSELKEAVIAALRTVKDPEIPVNIYDLGLIYELDVDDDGAVAVTMTLTTPNCPVAEMIPQNVKQAVEAVEGVASAEIKLVWEPPWKPEMMSDDAKLALDYIPGSGVAGFAAKRSMAQVTIGRRPTERDRR
jgi:FeS assembly SUF system protein